MKKFKSKMLRSMSFMLVSIMTLSLTVNAAEIDTVEGKEPILSDSYSVGFDTLNFTQDDYVSSAYTAGRSLDDKGQLENICASFIASSRAHVRNPDLYKSTAFVSDKCVYNSKIQYRLSEFDYLNALYKELGWEILEDNLSFDNIQVKINGNTAVVKVVESYTYYVTDGFDDESFRRREYTFTLDKNNSLWQITGVVTNDPWEDDNFTYQPINIKNTIDALQKDSIIECDKDAAEEIEPLSSSATMYKWYYSVNDAVDYAAKYVKNYNTVFGFTSGNDCQNFASQCVWAGLGGENSDGAKALPALSQARVGKSSYNVWCRNQDSSYYSSSEYEYNWAWDNVKGFAKLISVNNPSRGEGPFGTMHYTNAINNAEKGNVLYFTNSSSSATLSNLSHAMFVTSVDGTSGSRTKSNVKIAAHTNPTTSAYQTVAEYCGSYADNRFARANIMCGYYSELR